jgi:hypothetical protein
MQKGVCGYNSFKEAVFFFRYLSFRIQYAEISEKPLKVREKTTLNKKKINKLLDL